MDGRVLGTTDYVSPEQALGQSVTGQSDIYSLGVVLYEMLTGDGPVHRRDPRRGRDAPRARGASPTCRSLRPEVSAATAAVVDRATAKDLAQRYPDAASMVADLEEVLAIETARSGQATGEVTTVLRTPPGSTRRRLPWRMRHPVRWLVSLALLAALVALVLILAADQHAPRRRAGCRRAAGARPRCHSPRRRPTTTTRSAPAPKTAKTTRTLSTATRTPVWSTEHYFDGTLKKAGGTGVGLYVDAAPGVAASRSRSRRPRPASRPRSTSPTTSTSPCPTATRRRSPRAAGGARSGKTADVARSAHIPLDARRRALPLLPRLDHHAPAGHGARPRSPSSRCSGSRRSTTSPGVSSPRWRAGARGARSPAGRDGRRAPRSRSRRRSISFA